MYVCTTLPFVIILGLTPLTLAAELGLLDMYNHILMKERRIKWTYGGTSCAEYPLCDLDTVSDEGQVNNKSALHLIVYGKEVRKIIRASYWRPTMSVSSSTQTQ